ncbi:hypothetical protein CspeluHIS016_0308890 [Cutaneotrichosporon spelunceum]|uniref:Uncharacterized protein n=1 Tax=Cutaneotrichosporon spelunceum TaxID=1672016 RepID=A0AAD3TV43_9TREE|nr:hypothetical protein CspeluHIS016_0308890 [Cutaneotrichosporon spelunceum]
MASTDPWHPVTVLHKMTHQHRARVHIEDLLDAGDLARGLAFVRLIDIDKGRCSVATLTNLTADNVLTPARRRAEVDRVLFELGVEIDAMDALVLQVEELALAINELL